MRVTLDLPDEMHLCAKSRAKDLGLTLSKFVTIAIEERLEGQSKTRTVTKRVVKRVAKD
jgi:hypothetical protein